MRNPVQKDLYKLDYSDSHLWFLVLLKMYSEAFQLVETECLILTSKRILKINVSKTVEWNSSIKSDFIWSWTAERYIRTSRVFGTKKKLSENPDFETMTHNDPLLTQSCGSSLARPKLCGALNFLFDILFFVWVE